MQIVTKSSAKPFKNADNCTGIEFSFDDSSLNGALITIDGRYPESGYAMNKVCKELAYVTRGTGTVNKPDQSLTFSVGDTVFIDSNEKYYWEGDFDIYIVCTPSFFPEQYQNISA